MLKIADEGSKVSNTDEWSVALEDYNLICEKFVVMPEIDLMASAANTKCSAFYSKLSDKTALGTDFFIQELDNKRVMYICPQVKLFLTYFFIIYQKYTMTPVESDCRAQI